jgi:hypothetical protein
MTRRLVCRRCCRGTQAHYTIQLHTIFAYLIKSYYRLRMANQVNQPELLKSKHVNTAIQEHGHILKQLVSVGMSHELGTLPAITLDTPITIRKYRAARRYRNLQIVAFAVGIDNPQRELSSTSGELVDMHPQLSMRLSDGVVSEQGLVANLYYKPFQLSDSKFEDSIPNIAGNLELQAFDLQRGTHFNPENFIYGGKAELLVGSAYDRGPLAHATATIIDLTAELYGGYSQEQLNAMASTYNAQAGGLRYHLNDH